MRSSCSPRAISRTAPRRSRAASASRSSCTLMRMTLEERTAGRCELEDGPSIAAETARRLACDASVVRIVEDERGEPLDVGRKTRSIPPALRRALNSRDQGCCFPGCTQTRYVDGHHIRHWAEGGDTKLANLVSLCRFHHRQVHEGGITVQRLDDGAWRFTRSSDRSPIPSIPWRPATAPCSATGASSSPHTMPRRSGSIPRPPRPAGAGRRWTTARRSTCWCSARRKPGRFRGNVWQRCRTLRLGLRPCTTHRSSSLEFRPHLRVTARVARATTSPRSLSWNCAAKRLRDMPAFDARASSVHGCAGNEPMRHGTRIENHRWFRYRDGLTLRVVDRHLARTVLNAARGERT